MKKMTLLSVAVISLSIFAAEAFAYIAVAYTPDRKSIAVEKGNSPAEAQERAMNSCFNHREVKYTKKQCTLNNQDVTNGREYVSVVESSGDQRNWVGMNQNLDSAKQIAFQNCQRSGSGRCRLIFSMAPDGSQA